MEIEQRNFTRFYIDKPAIIYHEGKSLTMTVKDISLQGALLCGTEVLHKESPLIISITVDDMIPAITMQAEIRFSRAEDKQSYYGIQCTNIDLDNIQLLRSFMETLSMEPEDFLRECKAIWLNHTS